MEEQQREAYEANKISQEKQIKDNNYRVKASKNTIPQQPERKFFEISIGLIVSIIIIIGLIILNIRLGIHAYNIIKDNIQSQDEKYNASIEQHN